MSESPNMRVELFAYIDPTVECTHGVSSTVRLTGMLVASGEDNEGITQTAG